MNGYRCWISLAGFLLTLGCGMASAELRAGAAQVDITPPAGTPSAGYGARMGKGMEGVHDPLLATALVLDNGVKQVALVVGVDHLGMGKAMVDGVREQVQANPALAQCELFLGSSHTHSGGGAYLNLPGIGDRLAGQFDQAIYQSYIDGAAKAVLQAVEHLQPAKLGVGYGAVDGLNSYRGDWPPNVETRDDVAVIKVTTVDDKPLAVLFNFAAHPTVLGADNLKFSADYVGFARDALRQVLGEGVQPIFFNGAQGDVSPRTPEAADDFGRAEAMGKALAAEVQRVWNETTAVDATAFEVTRHTYPIVPPGVEVNLPPIFKGQSSEVGLLAINDKQAFVAIPGELSTIYDADLKRFGGWLGFEHVSILGLTNDAHGYIITPESWRHRTYESTLCFGGELYGDRVESMVDAMLHELEPEGSYNETRKQESTAVATLGGN
ncbi:MAG: neutral/alkaline non-lysosomal ceramidase N-terminal domain-containing protein [Candidatus Hydrogenedentes bacterium]|nr:neutral/alkaline non-lysosomal ceramidase N-terminal domain-containing protein [Candidatus Hydrogenedentota bacterium]